MSASETESRSARNSVRWANRRLFVELGWDGVVVASLVLVMLIAVGFIWGKSVYQPPAAAAPAEDPLALRAEQPAPTPPRLAERVPTERPLPASHRPTDGGSVATPSQARKAEPPPAAPEPAPVVTSPAAAATAAEFPFEPRRSYVTVQYFPTELKDTAIDAAAFLKAGGVDCVVVERKSDVEVVATMAFDLESKDRNTRNAERQRCDQLKARIRDLGKQFAMQQRAAKKPEYAFEQCFEKLRTR